MIEHSPHPMKDIEYMTVSVRNERGGDAEGGQKKFTLYRKMQLLLCKRILYGEGGYRGV